VTRLLVIPGQGKAEVKLENLLEQFEIPLQAVQRSPAENDRELCVLRTRLPRRAYHELMMTLADQPEVYSIQR